MASCGSFSFPARYPGNDAERLFSKLFYKENRSNMGHGPMIFSFSQKPVSQGADRAFCPRLPLPPAEIFWYNGGAQSEAIHHETTCHRHPGPCGRGQDHPVRGPAVHRRGHPDPGPGGPPKRPPGHPPAGTGAGHHHLFQTGPVPDGGAGRDPAGHPRPRGLLRRDGAHPAGAGLCHPGHLRHRRGPGPHRRPCGGCCAGGTSPPFSSCPKWTCPTPAGPP